MVIVRVLIGSVERPEVSKQQEESGRLFFFSSSNPVLSWHHLVPPELDLKLELTNAFFSGKCFLKLCHLLGNVPCFKIDVSSAMTRGDSP